MPRFIIHHFKRAIRLLFALSGFLLVLYLIRIPLLEYAGDFLSTADPIAHVEVVYVLGGSAEDRAAEAASILQGGYSMEAVFLGEHVSTVLIALGDSIPEAALTRIAAIRHGADSLHTRLLPVGTSTHEEFQAIGADIIEQGYQRVMVISNRFHLRRVRMLCRPIVETGVSVNLHPCINSQFNEDRWWESEEGLIMLNNEYVKLLYYLLKY